MHLGNLAQEYREFSEAEKWYKRSRDIAQDTDDQKLLTYSLNNLGNTFLKKAEAAGRRGKQEEWQEYLEYAQSCYETSLKMSKERGDQLGIVKATHGHGKIAHEQGDFAEAKKTFQRGADLAHQFSFRYSEGVAHASLGYLSSSQNNWQEAIDEYKKAISIFGEAGEVSMKADATRSLIDIMISRDDYASACIFLMDITSDYLAIGHMYAAAGSLDELISLLPIALSSK